MDFYWSLWGDFRKTRICIALTERCKMMMCVFVCVSVWLCRVWVPSVLMVARRLSILEPPSSPGQPMTSSAFSSWLEPRPQTLARSDNKLDLKKRHFCRIRKTFYVIILSDLYFCVSVPYRLRQVVQFASRDVRPGRNRVHTDCWTLRQEGLCFCLCFVFFSLSLQMADRLCLAAVCVCVDCGQEGLGVFWVSEGFQRCSESKSPRIPKGSRWF